MFPSWVLSWLVIFPNISGMQNSKQLSVLSVPSCISTSLNHRSTCRHWENTAKSSNIDVIAKTLKYSLCVAITLPMYRTLTVRHYKTFDKKESGCIHMYNYNKGFFSFHIYISITPGRMVENWKWQKKIAHIPVWVLVLLVKLTFSWNGMQGVENPRSNQKTDLGRSFRPYQKHSALFRATLAIFLFVVTTGYLLLLVTTELHQFLFLLPYCRGS